MFTTSSEFTVEELSSSFAYIVLALEFSQSKILIPLPSPPNTVYSPPWIINGTKSTRPLPAKSWVTMSLKTGQRKSGRNDFRSYPVWER